MIDSDPWFFVGVNTLENDGCSYFITEMSSSSLEFSLQR